MFSIDSLGLKPANRNQAVLKYGCSSNESPGIYDATHNAKSNAGVCAGGQCDLSPGELASSQRAPESRSTLLVRDGNSFKTRFYPPYIGRASCRERGCKYV